MRFLLSIHDVWPGNFQLVDGYLNRLRSLGINRAALLVVPNFHGQLPMDQSQEFIAWLKAQSAAGKEIFLHGYRHWLPELAEGIAFAGHRSLWGGWINRRWVQNEAEFCGLAAGEKLRLLKMGQALFQQTGIPCAGFVAPTWHGSPGKTELNMQGIKLQETRFFIHHLKTQQRRFAPPLAWGISKQGLRKLVGGEAWLNLLLPMPLLKVALHPGDLEHAETLKILDRIMARGKGCNYGELFP